MIIFSKVLAKMWKDMSVFFKAVSVIWLMVILTGAARNADVIRFVVNALPSVGYEGQVAYDSTDDTLGIYDAVLSAWNRLTKETDITQTNLWPDYQANYFANVNTYEEGTLATGSGGTPNVTIGAETTAPLSKSKNHANSYLLTKPSGGDYSDEGWNFQVSLERMQIQGGETIYFKINYETDATYDSDDFKVYYYLIGSNVLHACNGRSLISGDFGNGIPDAEDGGQFICTASAGSSDTDIRFIINNEDTVSQALTMVVDRVDIGPDAVITAPIVTEWQDFTMIISGSVSDPTKATTPTAEKATWRRVGDSMEVQYFYRGPNPSTGAAAGSGSYQFKFPTECTVDSSKIEITSSGGVNNIGVATVYDGVGAPSQPGTVNLINTTKFHLIVGDNAQADNVVGSGYIPITNTSVYYSFNLSVPCEEFANANAILSTTQADHSTVKVHANISTGETLTADVTDINFATEEIDTHNAWDGDEFTAPAAGTYDVEGVLRMTASGQRSISFYVDPGTGTPAVSKLVSTNAYTGLINKFSGSIFLEKDHILSIRSDLNSTTATGIVNNNWITIESRPDFSTFSVFGQYEYVEAECSATTTTVTATTFYDATGASIILTPGTWNVCYSASMGNEWVAGATSNSCQSLVRDGSDNIINGTSILTSSDVDSSYSFTQTGTSTCAEVTITETTTYKLSIESAKTDTSAKCSVWCGGNWTSALTAPDGETKIWARRMK